MENKKSESLMTAPFIALFFAAAVFFSLYGANTSLWLDEAFSVWLCRDGFQHIISGLKVDSNAPFYYFLLSIWMKFFGISEAALRSLSGVFYLACLPVIYALGKMVYDRKTAFFATLFCMISNILIYHAQNARPYTLLVLLSALSTLLFFRVIINESGSKKHVYLYTLINTLGFLTHYWYFFIVFAQGLCFFLFRIKNNLKLFLFIIGTALLPFLLWFPIFLNQLRGPSASWIQRPGLGDLFQSYLGLWPFKIMLILILVFFIWVIKKGRQCNPLTGNETFLKVRQRDFILVILLIVPILSPFILSFFKPMFVVNRYTVICLPAASLFAGRLMERTFQRKQYLKIIAVILIMYSAISFYRGHRGNAAKYSDRSTAEALVSYAKNDDIIIFTSLSKTTIDYYLDRFGKSDVYQEFTFPAEIDQHPGWLDIRKVNDRSYLLSLEPEA